MQRFKMFIDRDINLDNVNKEERLSAFGITAEVLPDPPEEFDEFEFRTGYSDEMDVIIGVAIEMGKVKRVLFGLSKKNDPDSFMALTEDQLKELLAQRGDQLVEFFEFITQ